MAYDETTGEVYITRTPEVSPGHIAMGNAEIIDVAQKPVVQEGNVRMAAELHAQALGGEPSMKHNLVNNVVELVTHPLR